MKKTMIIFLFMLAVSPAWAAPLKVATASTDLKYICGRIGGAEVRAESLASGAQDLHMVEPRPSMVFRLKKADMVVRVGLDLDMWLDSLINAAGNRALFYGAPGYVDASAGVPLLQKPAGRVDASMGDIHIYGNPHYWLDPANAKIMASNIMTGLKRLRPEKSDLFESNYAAFAAELDERLAGWAERMSGLKGLRIVTYHDSWPYFAARFGLVVVGHVEPKPGIPPTASHLEDLVRRMKSEGARIIVSETYYPSKGPDFLAERTGAAVLALPVSAGGGKGVADYFDVFETAVSALETAAGKAD
ncbi:MAG TPA: metal ABC transporter substrate-binding protein [Elusimicrobiales bacterium]|nr:metal ABC transporter substrate-binding protein [Elusimicrobiales bacterium]